MTWTIGIIAIMAYFYFHGLEKKIEELDDRVSELESQLKPSNNSEYDF